MRQSQLFSQSKRSVSKDETSLNAALLERGGYIFKTTAGAYSYLPLGLKVLHKISQIVRDELNLLPNTSEIQMTVLQPRDIWQETGRWDDADMRQVMYRVSDGGDATKDLGIGLGASHEENITAIFRSLYSSARQLPIAAYQIQTKFRNEPRAKSGLLRGREFMMKDLYSFHTTVDDFKEYYEQVAAAYMRIFERCGLNAIRTKASGGVFSKEWSDEFQVVTPIGEDDIYLNMDGDLAYNKEVMTDTTDKTPVKAVEVGNIFTLGDKYTAAMKATVATSEGKQITPVMGCYGIGISRLMGTIVEIYGEVAEKTARIVWPAAVAPVSVQLIDLDQTKTAQLLYEQLTEAGIEVLWDDRPASAGEKFADADLIGAPFRVIISQRSLDAGGVEVIAWPAGKGSVVDLTSVIAQLTD